MVTLDLAAVLEITSFRKARAVRPDSTRYFSLLSALLFIGCVSVSGQKRLEALNRQLLTADSVIIISHEPTAGFSLLDEKTGKFLPLPKLIVYDRINEKIVHEKRLLRDTAIQRLSLIATRPFQDSEIERGACFIPHHAIVLFKKGKASYIDICFGCRDIETSKDITITAWDIDNRKWEELRAFFMQCDMKYKLGYEEDAEDE